MNTTAITRIAIGLQKFLLPDSLRPNSAATVEIFSVFRSVRLTERRMIASARNAPANIRIYISSVLSGSP